MLSSNRCPVFRLGITSLLIVVGCAHLAVAQTNLPLDQSQKSPATAEWHFRFDLFQMLFEQKGLRPITDNAAAFRSPERTVVVSLGKFHFVKESMIEQFLHDDGALLLATDRLLVLGKEFSIQAGPVYAGLSRESYQGHSDCLRISDIDPTHALSPGIRQLITNRSGWIGTLVSPNDWRIMARLPGHTTPNGSGQKPIIATRANERLVVAADHSLFTNGMIWHGDNALLAVNVSNLLCSEGRDQVLFLVDGVAASSYLLGPLAKELPLPEPPADIEPDVDLEQMLQVANKVVAAVEDSNTFNKLLAGRPRGMPEPIYHRWLLFLLSMLLIGLTVYRLASKTSKSSQPAGLFKPRSAAAKQPSTARQFASPVKRGEAAQKLAQHFCRQVTASELPEVWERDLNADDKSSERLSRVVALARLAKPPHLSEANLLGYAQDISQLTVEFQQRKIQFSNVSRQAT